MSNQYVNILNLHENACRVIVLIEEDEQSAVLSQYLLGQVVARRADYKINSHSIACFTTPTDIEIAGKYELVLFGYPTSVLETESLNTPVFSIQQTPDEEHTVVLQVGPRVTQFEAGMFFQLLDLLIHGQVYSDLEQNLVFNSIQGIGKKERTLSRGNESTQPRRSCERPSRTKRTK